MRSKKLCKALVSSLVAPLAMLGASTAQATVIGATPGASLNGGYAFELAQGAAGYTFAAADATGNAAISVQTAGAARLYSAPFSGGDVSTYIANTGGFEIDDNFAAGTFEAYPQPTPVPFSGGDNFYVLGLDLADGLHYGYARSNDKRLESFGYQSIAGESIQTGAVPELAPSAGGNPVAEPSPIALLGFGLVLLGLGLAGRSAPIRVSARRLST